MEIIMSEEFGEAFFIIGTIIVSGIVWFGYIKGRFSPWLSWLATLIFISYATAYLGYRYINGEMAEHVATEPSYIALAAFHGTIALVAIVLAVVVFIYAERSFGRGENYFRMHKKISLVLVILWPLALLTGFFL